MDSRRILQLGVAVGLANYIGFALATALLGCDVLHGFSAGGHYFLPHGQHFVEVSKQAFVFCRGLAYALALTFPLGLLCASQWERRGPRDLDEESGLNPLFRSQNC